MSKISYILTSDAITVHVPGRTPYTMSSDNVLFGALINAARAQDIHQIELVMDKARAAKEYLGPLVELRGNKLFYKGEQVHGALVERVLQAMGLGLDVAPMLRFLKRLMRNPSFRSRKQLYDFLEASDMPILEDGRFVGYKWVREDGYDVHSRTNLHKVGVILEMDRSNVDDDPNHTCSHGLHVCSAGYTRFGERLFLVAVDPADVVSVPTDYNNSKMRVCKYEVIEEVQDLTRFEAPIYFSDEVDSEDFEDDTDWDSDFEEVEEDSGDEDIRIS